MNEGKHEPFWKKVAAPVAAGLILMAVAALGAVKWWDWLTESVPVSRLWLGFLWLCLVAWVLFGLVAVGALVFGNSEPPHLAYTEDNFLGLHWKWLWPGDGWIREATAYCLGCKRIMRWHSDRRWETPRVQTHFECQGCGHRVSIDGDHDEVIKKLAVEARHKVDTGTWEELVKRNESPK